MTGQKPYKQLISYLLPHWKKICLALICLLIGSLLSITPPLLIKHLIDKTVPTQDMHQFILLVLGIFMLPVLTALIQLGQYYLSALIGYKILLRLRKDLFSKVLALPLGFFNQRSSGEILSRINDDTSTIQSLVGEILFPGVQIASGILFSIPIMFSINWKLAIIGMAAYPISLLPSSIAGNQMRQCMKISQEKKANVTSYLAEVLSGIKTVKAFNGEEKEIKNYQEKNHQSVNASLKSYVFTILNSILFSNMVQGLSSAIVYSIGIWQIFKDTFSVGGLIAFTAYMPLIYAALTQLTRLSPAIQQQLVSLDRINEYMDISTKNEDKESHFVVGKVDFKNVGFTYRGQPSYALKDISFQINPGDFIAFVGPSGAGKSTIIDLLMGFYFPDVGTIEIDSLPLSTLSVNDLRRQIGLVSQDLFLFNRTVAENISYGISNCSESKIIEAAKSAYIHDRIMALPHQYHTIIGERGETLSGGERQRIAFARALIKKPKILILDEATSDLDSLSEQALQNTLAVLRQTCTIVAIAHRLSTILLADRIYVVDKGEIIEQGKYQELLQEHGLFAKLYHAQLLNAQ